GAGRAVVGGVAGACKDGPALTFEQVRQRTGAAAPFAAAALNRLALMGQLIHDLAGGVYRWRQIMPAAGSLAEVSPDNPETVAGRELARAGDVRVGRDERAASGVRLVEGGGGDRARAPARGVGPSVGSSRAGP